VSSNPANAKKKSSGLSYWMTRVLQECENVSADFSADPVHDLRVSLRRCRSMADGLMALDPHPDWKAMKKAGKRLFQRLGELRDTQIMMEWIEKLYPVLAPVAAGASLAPPGAAEKSLAGGAQSSTEDASPARDPVAHVLLKILESRESEQKREAHAALEEFDRKQWRQWLKSLPQRTARIRPGNAVYKHLALERWTAARDLHIRALRNRSKVALHTLRIGIKRFRYIVENFLPEEHKAWSDDLKHMQDMLGDVHDLDVLWATALSCHVFPDEISRKAWHARIVEERSKRIEEYRAKMVGPDSLWEVWRAGLPQGKQVHDLATRRLKLWAKVLDPDMDHSERVCRFAVTLYDRLTGAGILFLSEDCESARSSLLAAALLHDVGKSEGDKGHHKASLKLVYEHGTPLGWNEKDMRRAAIIARFHSGALPTRGHKLLRDLLPPEQKITIQLAAILRLANALDAEHNGHIRRIQIENIPSSSKMSRQRTHGFLRKRVPVLANEALVIAAEGYTAGSVTAQTIAAERYLLETVLRRPVVVKPMKSPALTLVSKA
jgi:CHAD domain-containing protein